MGDYEPYKPPTPPDPRTLSWTNPVCTDCWVQENSVPDPSDSDGVLMRVPTRLKDGDRDWPELVEQCCKCGRATTSQIFIRVDPTTVPYPAKKDD